MRGVLRRLAELGYSVNLFSGPIFADLEAGLKVALDKKFSLQQSKGGLRKSHNVLTIGDIEIIFNSEYCNPTNATGFRNRLIFAVGLALGSRPTELWLLDVAQFKREKVNVRDCFVFYPKVGSNIG